MGMGQPITFIFCLTIHSDSENEIMRLVATALISFLTLFSYGFTTSGETADTNKEQAYRLNQDAMMDMNTAQFGSAAEKFIQAAALFPDYAIRSKGLLYTPNFMAAWAYEKIGDAPKACRYFKRFIEVAPIETREETKTDHAKSYLGRHCRSMPPNH